MQSDERHVPGEDDNESVMQAPLAVTESGDLIEHTEPVAEQTEEQPSSGETIETDDEEQADQIAGESDPEFADEKTEQQTSDETEEPKS